MARQEVRESAITASVDVTASVVRVLALYALAEHQAGHASTLRVNATGRSFSVTDDGRGHAINRTVAGAPYLPFVYTHLDYPFEGSRGAPVQLHGLGMSLVNALCSELRVQVRAPEGTIDIEYREGRLHAQGPVRPPSGSTGNSVSGIVRPELQSGDTDEGCIELWLVSLLPTNRSLDLHFNGKALGASSGGSQR